MPALSPLWGLADAGCGAHVRGPRVWTCAQAQERPLLPSRRAFPQLFPRLHRQMPGTLSLGPFEERRAHAHRRWGFLLQVQLRAQEDRREPFGAPQSPCSISTHRRRDSPRTRGHGQTGPEGACRRPLLLTFWKAAGSFSFFPPPCCF